MESYDDITALPNSIGRRTYMQTGAADSLTWFAWDARGQMIGRTDQVNITGTYQTFMTWMGYDGAGRLVSQTYPSGDVLTTTYNNTGQPITLRNQTPRTFVSGALYNPLGQPTQVDDFNFQSNRYYYYGQGLNAPSVFASSRYGWLRQTCVVSQTATDCSESQRTTGVGVITPTILNMVYAYDNAGNVTAMDDRTRNVTSTFGYDDQDRLTSWTQGGALKESYGYDKIGNLTSKTGLGTMTYTDTAHIHALTKVTAGLVATYDANGNMLQRWTPSSWFTQTWNIFNQITRSVSAVTPTLDVRYFYDADNSLIRKVLGGVNTIYIGNYYEKNISTTLMTQYYYLGRQRVAMRVGTMVTSTVTFLHGDHLGSASAETNDSYGVKLAEMRYSPWGETYYISNTLSTDRQFTGQRQEMGFGVYDYGARFDSYIESSGGGRMYSPLLGRFISPDSIVPRPGDPQSLNRYSYTRNNPVSRIDPDGHDDKNPGKDILCKYNLAACLPEPQLTANGGGEALNVDDGSVEVMPGPGGTVMAKGSGKGMVQRAKDGITNVMVKLCQGLLAIICSGAGEKALEETKSVKPGDFGLKQIIKDASGMELGEAGQFFGWKVKQVVKSAGDFTKDGLISKGFTKEVLMKMAEAYEGIARTASEKTGLFNESAGGRAQQLREIIGELFED